MGCRKQGTTTRESVGSLSVNVAGREGQKPLCGFPAGATRLEKLELMGLSHMLKFCWLNFVLTPLPGLCSAVPTDNYPSAELYHPSLELRSQNIPTHPSTSPSSLQPMIQGDTSHGCRLRASFSWIQAEVAADVRIFVAATIKLGVCNLLRQKRFVQNVIKWDGAGKR